MADYDEVLDKQADFIEFHKRDDFVILKNWVDKYDSEYPDHEEGIETSVDDLRWRTKMLCDSLYGEPYFVAPRICDLIQTASQNIPLNWAFTEEHLFSNTGFVYLTKLVGNTRIMTWQTAKLKDSIKGALFVFWREKDRLLFPLRSFFVSLSGQVTIEGVNALFLDCDQRQGNPKAAYPAAYIAERIAQCQYLACFLLFVVQQIIVPSPQLWSRATGRRVEKINPDLLRKINVITLRRQRYRDDSDNHVDVDWQVQWAVRGHWRQQYHPSTQNRVPRWINPYIKGPPDKPMKNADHLFDVRR